MDNLDSVRKFRNADEVTDRIGELAMEQGPRAAVTQIRSLLDDELQWPADQTRADLLVELGEYLSLTGDEDAAGAALRAAVDDGGETFIDARAWLLSWCLRNDHADEAKELVRQLSRERSSDPGLYEIVGEAYEQHDDLAAATIWFTSGLQRAQSEYDYEDLAIARLRVRAARGFPPDEDDELAVEVLANRRASDD